ncbi:hypothetical protein [Methyloraptor flagellatus]|uniref:Uncharacterized protein n=1 Tax=Methyloraptor flagellatus TaxID=3162530 RepID=A0AAU7XG22_9HYPH
MTRKTTAPMSPARPSDGFVLGAERFDKIAAVEGLKPPASLIRTFAEMDRRDLSAEERIAHLKAVYGAFRDDR